MPDEPLTGKQRPTACMAENRQSCEPGLRLAIASMAEHSPGVQVVLFFPEPSPAFERWLKYHPDVLLNPFALRGSWDGWAVKPVALQTLLHHGYQHIFWFDSDIIVTRDIRPLLDETPSETLILTEEALCVNRPDPGGLRARLWGFEVGRVLPFTMNTAFVRVTPRHAELLQAWRDLLESQTYLEAQKLPFLERSPHLLGDQESLTALVASKRFADIPLRLLRRGHDIVQCFGMSGYTVGERMITAVRSPLLVHSQGNKPWWAVPPSSTAKVRLLRLYEDLSPYKVRAARYAGELEDIAWLRPRTRVSRWLRWLGAGRPSAVGLPIAALSDLTRLGKRLTNRFG